MANIYNSKYGKRQYLCGPVKIRDKEQCKKWKPKTIRLLLVTFQGFDKASWFFFLLNSVALDC